VTDLNAALRFSHLPESNDGHLVVRYARELHMQDLKDANVVLLGSNFSNPWAELFEKNMNFEFSYQPHPNVSLIHNKLLIKNLENLSPLYLLWHDGLVAKLKKTEADV